MKSSSRRICTLAVAMAATFPFAAQAAGETAALRQESAKSLFQSSCVVCHGADGTGTMPGVSDLTAVGGPLAQPAGVLRKRVLEGFQNPGSAMAMPPKGGNPNLTEADVARLIDYMQATFKPWRVGPISIRIHPDTSTHWKATT